MSNAIIPEIVGQTEILEESPMTEQEQKELIETETVIKSSFQGKMERDLAIGAGLLKIKRQKLYRGANGGRLWVDYLKEESAKLALKDMVHNSTWKNIKMVNELKFQNVINRNRVRII